MSAAPAPRHLRGCFVGAVTGALTIAAHGLGGGGYPDSTAAALLLVVAAAVGVCATSVRTAGPTAILALLGLGQLGGHLTLAGLTGHQHGPSAIGPLQMAGAHCVAALLCGALIVVAERLHTFSSAVARVVTVPLAVPLHTWRTTIFAGSPTFVGSVAASSISRRGPPRAAA
jgi:hypothetical protein